MSTNFVAGTPRQAWWAKSALVGGLLAVIWFLPYQTLAEAKRMLPFIMVGVPWLLYFFENHSKTDNTSKSLVQALTFSIVLLGGTQQICDIQADRYKPIAKASGVLHIKFDRPTLPRVTHGLPLSPARIVRAPFYNGQVSPYMTVAECVFEAPKAGETLTTNCTIYLNTRQIEFFENQLDTISAKNISQEFDYIQVMVGQFFPDDVSFIGDLTLTLNDIPYHFDIPRHYPSKLVPTIIVPLNDKARKLMLPYDTFRPRVTVLRGTQNLSVASLTP